MIVQQSTFSHIAGYHVITPQHNPKHNIYILQSEHSVVFVAKTVNQKIFLIFITLKCINVVIPSLAILVILFFLLNSVLAKPVKCIIT